MPAFSLDNLLGFVLSMLWRATAVTYLTHLACALLGLRGRCLSHWLRKLLLQAGPLHLRGRAGEIADSVLRHPMIGAPAWRGDTISREQLVLILLELAETDEPFSPALRTALDCPAVHGRLTLWFDQAMTRATRSYRFQTKILTGVASLCVLRLTGNGGVANLRELSCQWIPLSLGAPFWYDFLKRLAPLLRGASAGRARRRRR